MNGFRWIVAVAALVASCLYGCGKSSEQRTGAAADSTVAVPSAISAALEAKGFKVVQDGPAPSQPAGRKASLVVYRTPDGKQGGVVYALRPLDLPDERVGWHWYFADAAPDSAALAEINRDGLWDVRIYFRGRTVEAIQGESFSLLGRERRGMEAMNGAASAPAASWKCFDGDSTSAWQSPRRDAFIDVPVPLGIQRAELDVLLAAEDQPGKITVYADGRKLQTLELSSTIARQTFRLDPDVRTAAEIRLEVEGGKGDSVAVSELEIR
ncbi:MAG: hypothetical protein OEX18_14310 [Candidatus Krumholzibacteria bacterium]|nr:hypothetical protein [Candidatus Krumholzibacteria bacterium]MDH4338443.1 hypothetical protein [Candidatus Krumholzibacteria bacterium]MDH5271072.1 hypothetical protein [Candidatus Krumholzibacteria bacterium]